MMTPLHLELLPLPLPELDSCIWAKILAISLEPPELANVAATCRLFHQHAVPAACVARLRRAYEACYGKPMRCRFVRPTPERLRFGLETLRWGPRVTGQAWVSRVLE